MLRLSGWLSVGILTALVLLPPVAHAEGARGTIEVVGSEATFHVTVPPSSISWYADAYTDSAVDHCASPESGDIVAVSGNEEGTDEASFSANLAQVRDHIGPWDICLYAHGVPSLEGAANGLLAEAPYDYPPPTGSIYRVIDETFDTPLEVKVDATITEPFSESTYPNGEESRWSWSSELTFAAGEVPCAAKPADESRIGGFHKLAFVASEAFSFEPPATSGQLTLCLYARITGTAEEGIWLLARDVFGFPSLPTSSPKAESAPVPEPAPTRVPKYVALTLATAGKWAAAAVKDRFRYAPSHFRATHCTKRGNGRYRCDISWKHGQYTFTGTVEVGAANVYTGRFTYRLHVARTNLKTHQRRTLIAKY
jgi:hypothetical protein